MKKDVFCFWQLQNADFSGKYEIPIVKGTSKIPDFIIPFSKRKKTENTYCQSIHFYEDDSIFETCFQSESKSNNLISTFRNFQSIILPDFSVYRDMPLAMQIFQIYKIRAVGNFLMQKEIPIIPNVRWGDERSYDFCFEGIEKHSVIAVGVLGGLKNADDRKYFIAGFYEMLARLEPDTILCYGNIPDELAIECKNKNIVIKEFKTEIAISHAKDEKKQFLFGL